MTTPRSFDIKDLDEAMVTLGRLRDCLVTKVEAPPLDEPTGLGAVVRDSTGRLWTRIAQTDHGPWRWARRDPDDVGYLYAWADIKDPEILSCGYDGSDA